MRAWPVTAASALLPPTRHLPPTCPPVCLQPLGLYGFALTTALLQASVGGQGMLLWWALPLGLDAG